MQPGTSSHKDQLTGEYRLPVDRAQLRSPPEVGTLAPAVVNLHLGPLVKRRILLVLVQRRGPTGRHQKHLQNHQELG